MMTPAEYFWYKSIQHFYPKYAGVFGIYPGYLDYLPG